MKSLSSSRVALVLSLSWLSCGEPPKEPEGLPRLPPVTSAPLATERRWLPVKPVTPQSNRPPSTPSQFSWLWDNGFGEVAAAPGLSPSTLTLDGAAPPSPGANRKLLLRFVHLADTQLTDDESPVRVVSLDQIGATSGAFRPQEAWGCQGLNAAVRSINALHTTTPIDLVMLGGDNIDNAQQNEARWFRSVMNGAESIECDSGDDDDPTPGPSNDAKDPFYAEGLTVPWRWVTGNHDILNQGNFPITDTLRATAVGTAADLGTRSWSRPNAPTTVGPVPADAERDPLIGTALLDFIAEQGDGHGLRSAGATIDGKAFYALDIDGAPLRLIVLDSAAPTGGADGLFLRSDLDARVKPLLDEAEAQGRYVLLFSHHAARALTDGSGFGGTRQDGAVLTDAWREYVGAYPHVVMHIAAHSHEYRAGVARPATGHAYFETESASLTDWPAQLRLFEVWDEDNGFLHVRAVPFDFSEEGDALAGEYRRRAATDFTSGWAGGNTGDDGAVDFWFPMVR